jgi:hypothetical protein
VHAVATADEGNEVTWRKAILVHVIFDRLHRVRQVERIMFALPCLDQRDQHIESIAFGRVALRHHEALDFLENATVIALGFDRCDFHGTTLQTVCASIASYWWCVPMKRM